MVRIRALTPSHVFASFTPIFIRRLYFRAVIGTSVRVVLSSSGTIRAATHACHVQIFSGQMQWPDIAARTLDPPVAQHNSEWQVLEVLMHWPWDRLVLSRTGMGVVQARALGISLAMATARGAAPLELTCNGTLRTEHLASGSLAAAGARRRPPGAWHDPIAAARHLFPANCFCSQGIESISTRLVQGTK